MQTVADIEKRARELEAKRAAEPVRQKMSSEVVDSNPYRYFVDIATYVTWIRTKLKL